MSNVSDEDFSETSSISGSESSAESSESFYSTAEDVERYDDSLEPIATEEEIASYTEQLSIEEEEEEMLWSRFSGEVDVGTWSVLRFSLLHLTIATIDLNLLTLRFRSREMFSRSLSLLSFRCKCSNCSLEFVVKPDECRCCTEVNRCSEKMEEIDMEGACITAHSGFDAVCLNTWVLQTAGVGLKTRRNKSYSTMMTQLGAAENE